jgi:hypothetical protein
MLLGSVMLFAACEKETEDKEESKSSACDIVSFKVDTVEWKIGDSTITHIYPLETKEGDLTPTITLSPGATINPQSGVAQNFFTAQGVTYTVTAEDGVTTKTYTATATITLNTACDIVSFKVDTVEWKIGDSTITHIYPPETKEGDLTPTITMSPGATINPQSGVAQNFFTAQGVTYTVTAEDGITTKTYAVKASIEAVASDGNCTWSITGVAGNYTLTIAGNGAMDDYDYNRSPWYEEYGADIKTVVSVCPKTLNTL